MDVRSRIGGWRGSALAALFPPPSWGTDRTSFQVVGSPVPASLPLASPHCASPHQVRAVPLSPFALRLAFPAPPSRSSLLRREVGGPVLIAQEHQPPPPEPDVRLVTASGSHGISYVFLIHTGCMPDQRDSSHRNLHGESSDGMWCKQEFVYD